MHLHLLLLLLVPVLQGRKLRMLTDEVADELTNSMEENEVANSLDTEAEEESNESVDELELEAANSDEEEADELNDIAVEEEKVEVKEVKRLNWVERCGSCEGVAEEEVCGSDGKTYSSSCALEFTSCRRYWDILEVAKVSAALHQHHKKPTCLKKVLFLKSHND